MWRTTKVDPKIFEFIYRDYFRVTIPCIKFKPVMGKVDIMKLENVKLKYKDAYPNLSNFLLRMAKQLIVTFPRDLSTPEVSDAKFYICLCSYRWTSLYNASPATGRHVPNSDHN
jgi:hypothetical protein